MTSFDDLKRLVRRNKLLGMWVAENLGLAGRDADAYADALAADLRQSLPHGVANPQQERIVSILIITSPTTPFAGPSAMSVATSVLRSGLALLAGTGAILPPYAAGPWRKPIPLCPSITTPIRATASWR